MVVIVVEVGEDLEEDEVEEEAGVDTVVVINGKVAVESINHESVTETTMTIDTEDSLVKIFLRSIINNKNTLDCFWLPV